jgi:3-methyladenine DNA glycosylase/8-oxoguanine DNA glycosylase
LPATSGTGTEVRAEVVPSGPYRLPRASPDGLLRRRGGVLFRYVRRDGHDLLLRATQLHDGRVVVGAAVAGSAPEPAADPRIALDAALRDWRRMLGCDVDLRPFVAEHRNDPLIGASLRTRPWLLPARRMSVFESLLAAITEQLIAYEDAVVIQRRIIARHGRALAPLRPPHPRLREAPDVPTVAGRLIPAHFEACGLAPSRAAALHRAAREIASGRIDVAPGTDPDRLLTRLGRIPEIGSWTLALVATQALGRFDRAPSGDLNLVKALGRLRTGDPRARVAEHEVDAWLARFAPWGALAAAHIMATRPETLRDPTQSAAAVPLADAAAVRARRAIPAAGRPLTPAVRAA